MDVVLKKPQIIALCNAYDDDSIISPDTQTFFWKNKRTRVDMESIAVLFDYGLLEWVSGLDCGSDYNEAMITYKGREVIDELCLSTYAYSR